MKVGDLVHDSDFGMNGIIIDTDFHPCPHDPHADYEWEFLVLYEDGSQQGADTHELEAANESR